MKITFVSKYSFDKAPDGRVTSGGASARLRVAEPAMILHRLGHVVRLKTIPPEATDFQPDFHNELVVVSKIIEPAILDKLASLALAGLPVVVDICDNRLNHPVFGQALCRLVAASLGVFCNTAEMARVVDKAVPGKLIRVLTEPVEGEVLPRKALAVNGARLLWFGHQDGLPQLQRAYPSYCQALAGRPASLQILCGATPEVLRWVAQTNEFSGGLVPVSFSPWAPRALREACRISDIALLPGSEEEFWLTKSPNRLLQALWYGLRVAAHPFPSYRPYADHCVLDADPAAALVRALTEHPETNVQAQLAQECSSEAVGRAWACAIEELVAHVGSCR